MIGLCDCVYVIQTGLCEIVCLCVCVCVCVTRETQASAVEDEGICEAVAGGFQGYNSTFNQLKMILYASIL